jgi:hypothetical protein
MVDPYDPSVQDLEFHNWSVGSAPLLPRAHARTSGTLAPFSAGDSRSDVFLKLFDIEISKDVMRATNDQLRIRPGTSTGHLLSLVEQQTYVALRLVPRTNPRRTLNDYWASSASAFHLGNEWMKQRMTLDRFCAISSHFRFDYRRAMDRVVSNSLDLRTPGYVVALDESMIPYVGDDCTFKVHIARKPDPDGIEVIDMCDNAKFCCGLSIRDDVSISCCALFCYKALKNADGVAVELRLLTSACVGEIVKCRTFFKLAERPA